MFTTMRNWILAGMVAIGGKEESFSPASEGRFKACFRALGDLDEACSGAVKYEDFARAVWIRAEGIDRPSEGNANSISRHGGLC